MPPAKGWRHWCPPKSRRYYKHDLLSAAAGLGRLRRLASRRPSGHRHSAGLGMAPPGAPFAHQASDIHSGRKPEEATFPARRRMESIFG